MKKVKAFIEKGTDGTYGVYVDLDDHTLNYGIFGDGNTVKEAIEDFKNSYESMKQFHAEENKKFVEAEFEFLYDTASFLQYYSTVFTKTALSNITGLNRSQLSQYAMGIKKPRPETIKKIDDALHRFYDEMSQVHLV